MERKNRLMVLSSVIPETFKSKLTSWVLVFIGRVFVNGRGRDVIMQDIRRRIERGDINLEIEETIKAMCDIAMDRARKLQM